MGVKSSLTECARAGKRRDVFGDKKLHLSKPLAPDCGETVLI
jgi:hypothetical protein